MQSFGWVGGFRAGLGPERCSMDNFLDLVFEIGVQVWARMKASAELKHTEERCQFLVQRGWDNRCPPTCPSICAFLGNKGQWSVLSHQFRLFMVLVTSSSNHSGLHVHTLRSRNPYLAQCMPNCGENVIRWQSVQTADEKNPRYSATHVHEHPGPIWY